MITATSLKNGTTFEYENTPYKVLKYFHQKIARGGGTIKLTLRNLKTGEKLEKVFNSSVKVKEIATVKKPMHFLYKDADTATFMDPSTYEQIEIPVSSISDEIKYLKEGQEADIIFWNQKPLAIDIPPKVTLKVAQTDPGVKGNSATNIYKPATLENSMDIKVPLFIKTGDKIRVDTRTNEYVERVN